MSVEEVEEKNKVLVREFLGEAWGKGNMTAVDEFMAADYVEHPRPSNLPVGTEGLKQLIAAYRTAFPYLKVTLDDILPKARWWLSAGMLAAPTLATGWVSPRLVIT